MQCSGIVFTQVDKSSHALKKPMQYIDTQVISISELVTFSAEFSIRVIK